MMLPRPSPPRPVRPRRRRAGIPLSALSTNSSGSSSARSDTLARRMITAVRRTHQAHGPDTAAASGVRPRRPRGAYSPDPSAASTRNSRTIWREVSPPRVGIERVGRGDVIELSPSHPSTASQSPSAHRRGQRGGNEMRRVVVDDMERRVYGEHGRSENDAAAGSCTYWSAPPSALSIPRTLRAPFHRSAPSTCVPWTLTDALQITRR
ncbi:hypothetical protein C8R46DRAFT_46497 [Mycena filopes]|nr:hypothetical protein C8R46DRAFT_46497 [Mycena filopes]